MKFKGGKANNDDNNDGRHFFDLSDPFNNYGDPKNDNGGPKNDNNGSPKSNNRWPFNNNDNQKIKFPNNDDINNRRPIPRFPNLDDGLNEPRSGRNSSK